MKARYSIISMLIALLLMTPVVLANSRAGILKRGDRDTQVLKLQQALVERGYIGLDANGSFDEQTALAVRQFQEDNGLSVDGKAGPDTQRALFNQPLGYDIVNRPDFDRLWLLPGETRLEVGELQRRLIELDYLEYDGTSGRYDAATQAAVLLFERTNSLELDAVADPQLLSLLFSEGARQYMIREGNEGADVKRMQRRLKELGYYDNRVSGAHDTASKAALSDFQAENGLNCDGVLGNRTQTKLYSPYAIAKATGDTVTVFASVGSGGAGDMLTVARQQLGKKYVWSDEGPESFDCSGLVYYVLNSSGVKVGRFSAAGYCKVDSWGRVGSIVDLRPGDLMFFRSPKASRISHTGIYIGSGEFIHASTSAGKVLVGKVTTRYWEDNFVMGRRIFM